MPTQLAHEAVNLALNYTEKTVEWGKSKPGFLKSVIERVEGPVVKTLETRAIKTVVKVGDRVLTTVDGTLDKAISSTYYKSGEAYVKSAYSNRIVPATNTVTTTVASTTSRVTTPVVNVYSGILAFADKQVEFYLPQSDSSDRHLPLTVVGVTTKATRRTIRKVGAVRTAAVARVGKANKSVRATIKFAYEQSKPSNVKKNAVKAYRDTLVATDSIVDRYLPDQDGVVAKGPITLVTKVTKRASKHTLKQIKSVATAVKNSPSTFKKACTSAINAARAQVARVQNMSLSIQDKAYDTLTPYIEAVLARSMSLVKVTDSVLLKYPLTTAVRNFAVDKYTGIVAPIVAPVLNRFITVAPAAKMATSVKTEYIAAPTESHFVPESEEAAEPAEEETKKKSKKSKKSKKVASEVAADATDDAAYC